ncbi:hypothetical protein B0H10DRAFT_1969914 [Mycena sp. CBHHK59/15]|nr:hypothetical protein B0H10DRAFT_1969914 [Mycena sp. CBHHK59/15]
MPVLAATLHPAQVGGARGGRMKPGRRLHCGTSPVGGAWAGPSQFQRSTACNREARVESSWHRRCHQMTSQGRVTCGRQPSRDAKLPAMSSLPWRGKRGGQWDVRGWAEAMRGGGQKRRVVSATARRMRDITLHRASRL